MKNWKVSEETEAQTLARWSRHDDRMMWLERMKKYGSLYAPTHDEAMFKIIAADIEEELGFGLEEVEEVPGTINPINEWKYGGESAKSERCKACGSLNVKQFSCEAGWQCERCSSPVGTVWGCLSCAEVVCEKCVCMSSASSWGMTLEEIGALFEVSRERIRQIECHAIRKLQHPSRSKLLYEYFYDKPRRDSTAKTLTSLLSLPDVVKPAFKDPGEVYYSGDRHHTFALDPLWGREYAYPGYYEGAKPPEKERLQEIEKRFGRAIELMGLKDKEVTTVSEAIKTRVNMGVSPRSDAYQMVVHSGKVMAKYTGDVTRSVISCAFSAEMGIYAACVLNNIGVLVYANSLDGFIRVEG